MIDWVSAGSWLVVVAFALGLDVVLTKFHHDTLSISYKKLLRAHGVKWLVIFGSVFLVAHLVGIPF